MIALIGSTGYIGSAFKKELEARGLDFECVDHHSEVELLKPDSIINAAGYTGKKNIHDCDENWSETIEANALLPAILAQSGIPIGHVSTGNPDQDGLYFQSKKFGEDYLLKHAHAYIWRCNLPFDEIPHPKNFLSKLKGYERVSDSMNSLCHRRDFVRGCLDLWEKDVPFGIYPMNNPGKITNPMICEMMGITPKEFYYGNDSVMDCSATVAAGVTLRPIDEALEEAIKGFNEHNS